MSEFQKNAFDEFYLSDEMLNALEAIGYEKPTPVQSSSIPLVMAGIDLIVQSQTGTGKTAAFAIPVLEMLDPRPGRNEVLVLAPTRELARQVAGEFERIGANKDLKVATIYGGTSYERQYDDLAESSIVCATPGRLLDILQRGKLDLSNLRILCLDEADEMLSMGFAEELDAIMKFLPEDRQSLLFSATITAEVKALAGSMLYYPEFVTHSEDSVAQTDVDHAYYNIKGVGRPRDLLKILEFEEPESAIIFANTRGDTFMVTRFLKRHGRRAEVLNGDLPQKERERTLEMLRAGKIDFLVATDVAARGIDISDLSHVFNYTLPDSAEVYIHRTGRTGRAGKKGRAISLVSPREMGTLFNIKKLYPFPMIQQALPTPGQILEAKQSRRIAKLSTELESVSGLAYGAKLGVARSLVSQETISEDHVRLVARLLSLADGVISGNLQPEEVAEVAAEVRAAVADDDAEEAASDSSSDVVEAAPEEAVEEEAVEEEVVEEEAVEEEVVEAKAKTKAASSDEADESEKREERRSRRGRRRRGSRRNDEAEASSNASDETAEAKSDESADDQPPRRRRRRRRSDDEETATAEAATESKPEKSSRSSRGGSSKSKERNERGDRNGRGRGRARGRGRNGRSRDRRSSSTEEIVLPELERQMQKVWMSLGKNHFETNQEVVEMVCYMAGMEPDDLGEVSLENSYTYVEVREDYFYDIINALNNQDWNGVTVSAEPARK